MITRPTSQVLLVDDDEDEWVLTRDRLEEASPGTYRVDWTSSYDEAIRWLRERHFAQLRAKCE